MTAIEIKNNINQTEARIGQIENASFYSEEEKKQLIKTYQNDLEQLYLKQAKDIAVTTQD